MYNFQNFLAKVTITPGDYLFSPEEGSCYVFSIRNNCCEYLASYGAIIQSVIQSYFCQDLKIHKVDIIF